MPRVICSASKFVRHLSLCALTVSIICAAGASNAASDGLAISGSPPTRATVGQSYSFTPTVSDPAGRALSFTIVNKPSWATFSASTGRLSGTPVATSIGTYPDVDIRVTDGVSSASLEFSLTVAASAADKPVISGSPPTSVAVGQSYSFTPTVSNPLKVALTFAIVNKPAWATFSSQTGKLAGTPTTSNIGTQADIRISATDKVATALLPEFSIRVVAATGADKPVISGAPPTSVTAGSTYKFQPTAKDPDGKTLSFSVQNKPAWASFSIASGLLDGTPTSTQVGNYGNIIISTSNGQYSSSLPGFNVAVTTTQPATGNATVNWVPPTENTNGSALTDLAGIRIYYGTSPSSLSKMVQVASPTATSYTIGNLAAGTWYFGGVAYTTSGVQSAMSAVASALIP